MSWGTAAERHRVAPRYTAGERLHGAVMDRITLYHNPG